MQKDFYVYILTNYTESTFNDAITREKQLKNWHRQWKINLIKISNPDFEDMSKNLFGVENEKDAGSLRFFISTRHM